MIHEKIELQLEPQYINMFNRIMEGYEYVGIVSTLDAKAGLVVVRTTPDMHSEALQIIENLPFEVNVNVMRVGAI